jgi:hypothetical protein
MFVVGRGGGGGVLGGAVGEVSFSCRNSTLIFTCFILDDEKGSAENRCCTLMCYLVKPKFCNTECSYLMFT